MFAGRILAGLCGVQLHKKYVSGALVNTAEHPQPKDGSVIVRPSIRELREQIPEENQVVWVLGYHSPFDGGGGLFVGQPASEREPDGGLVVESESGGGTSGRWVRMANQSSYNGGWWRAHPSQEGAVNADAFQRCVDAVPEGSTIAVPEGIYDVSGPIVIDGKQVDFVGAGDGYWGWDDGGTVLRATDELGVTDDLLLITDTTSEEGRTNNVRVADLQLIGGKNRGSTGRDGIHVTKGWNVRIERVTVKEASRDGMHLRSGEEQVSNLCMLYHCHASNNGQDGYYFLAHDSWASFCRGNHNRRNGITVGATNVGLNGLRLDLNGGDGARILSKHCRCASSMADLNGGHGFHVTGPGHIITGNMSSSNGTREARIENPCGFRLGVENSPDEQSVFSENVALRNQGDGFWLDGGAHVFKDTNTATGNQGRALRHGDSRRYQLSARQTRTDVDLAERANDGVATFTVQVPEAASGDAVSVQPDRIADGLLWSAFVREPGQVEVRVFDPTGEFPEGTTDWTVHIDR